MTNSKDVQKMKYIKGKKGFMKGKKDFQNNRSRKMRKSYTQRDFCESSSLNLS